MPKPMQGPLPNLTADIGRSCFIRPNRGLTLIELVLVCALIAIALSLAVPTYQQYIRRSHRVEAIGELLALAACQERTRAFSGSYNTTECAQVLSAERYLISYVPASSAASPVFRLEARPLGPQVNDACGSLILDHAGLRSTSRSGADSARCWAGR